MSALTPAPDTTGKGLFEATSDFRARDDNSDRKSGGTYLHSVYEWSATEANEWVGFMQFVRKVCKAGGVSLAVRNESGGALAVGPVRVVGYNASEDKFLVNLADADANAPADFLLLTSLSNNTNGVAYIGGDFTYNTAGRTVGDACYLAADGTVTFTAPSGSDQIVQEVGRVKVVNASGTIAGLVNMPTKFGSSWLQSGAVSVAVGSISGLGTNVATWLATPSSANLRAALTDETGTGAAVFADTPTLVTPVLGTPTSGTLTNCTDLPVSTGVSGLGTGVATFLTTPSSANLRSALTDETGTGAAVFATSPTLVTPILGTPTSGTLTNCTGHPVSALGSVGSTGQIPISNGSALAMTSIGTDATLTSAGVLKNVAVSGADASGTNTAGTDVPLSGGKGTGTGEPGVVVLKYPLKGASGTTVHSNSTQSFPVSSTLFTGNAANVTVTASTVGTTETTLLGTVTGSKSLEGGLLRVGRQIRLTVFGLITTSATPPTIRVRVKHGSTTIADTLAQTPPASISARMVSMDFIIHTRSVGASASLVGGGKLQIVNSSGAVQGLDILSSSTIDSTSTQTLDLTIEYGANTAGNNIVIATVTAEYLN